MFPFVPVPMDIAHQAYVQARGEERARTGNDVSAVETELNPQLRYDTIWDGGQSHFVAIYQPRFVYTRTMGRPDIDTTLINPLTLNTADPNDTPFSALHNGGIGFEKVERRWRLSAYQFAAYGPITTTALLVQPPWSGDGFPADPNPIIPSTIAARFRLLFAQTQVFVPIRLSRRAAITPGFTYNAFGGADSSSRGVIAMTRGPGANVVLDVAASKYDRLATTVGAGTVQVLFEGDRQGANIYRAETSEAWRHWFTPNLSSEVALGASVGGDSVNGFTYYTVGQAGLLYDSWSLPRIDPGAPPYGIEFGRGNRLQAGVIVKMQPWLDLFSGGLEQRGVGVAALNYTIDRVTLRGQLSAAKVLPQPRTVAEYQIFQGDSSVRYRFTPTVSSDLGVRFGAQDFDNAVRFNQTTQATFFLALLWAPLPAKF